KAIPTIAATPVTEHRTPNTEHPASFTPSSAGEACEMVASAISAGQALLPVGGGRRADFGNLSERPVTPLRTEKLSGIIEHDADNQTVTLGAGMTLAAAQAFLAPHRQWLPFRPPLGQRNIAELNNSAMLLFPAGGCTVGGMVALGACGPERLAYGAPRDALLGLRFVSGTAKHIKAGGRVIKNVAGYDITRLLAGSAGTLGLLTELTFRVSAVPEVCRVLRASGTLAQCAAAASELLRSRLCPIFVTASPVPNLESGISNLGSASWRESAPWTSCVGFEGFDATVAAQLDGCSAVLSNAGLGEAETLDYPILDGIHAQTYRTLHDAAFVVRADVSLNAVSAMATVLPNPARCLLDFGCGRVTLGFASLSDEEWAALCSAASDAGGHVVAEKAPAEFKQQHDVFAPERPAWNVMRRLKAALDPHGVFAPGRLPGRR
ncbi:MAG: FAD-binding protein, partial [Planctomycetes bacterium]|nr:FAD-binding protein [Planctomycetota bacterium]